MTMIPVYTADVDEDTITWKQAKWWFEFSYVTELLTYTAGNVSAAARLACKDRKDFYDVLRRCEVDPNDFRRKRRKASASQRSPQVWK